MGWVPILTGLGELVLGVFNSELEAGGGNNLQITPGGARLTGLGSGLGGCWGGPVVASGFFIWRYVPELFFCGNYQ